MYLNTHTQLMSVVYIILAMKYVYNQPKRIHLCTHFIYTVYFMFCIFSCSRSSKAHLLFAPADGAVRHPPPAATIPHLRCPQLCQCRPLDHQPAGTAFSIIFLSCYILFSMTFIHILVINYSWIQ